MADPVAKIIAAGPAYDLIGDLIVGGTGVLLLWMFVLSLIGGHRRHKQQTRDLADTDDSAIDPWLFS